VWYLAAGVTEYYEEWAKQQPGPVTERDFVDRINAALVIVKFPDDGKGRFCNNLTGKGRSINKGLVPRPFQHPRLTGFLVAARRGDWFRRKDLAKAFYQMRLSAAGRSRKQTGFVCPLYKQLARYTAPVFGLCTTPEYLFVLVSAVTAITVRILAGLVESLEASGQGELAAELERAAASLDPYADDFIWVGTPVAGAIVDLVLTLEGEALGLRWDPEKDVAGPGVTVLGARIDSRDLTIGIDADKARAYRVHLEEVLQGMVVGKRMPRATLETLAGRLGFCTVLSRWCTSFMTTVWRALWPAGHTGEPPEWVDVSQELVDYLRGFRLAALADPESPSLGCGGLSGRACPGAQRHRIGRQRQMGDRRDCGVGAVPAPMDDGGDRAPHHAHGADRGGGDGDRRGAPLSRRASAG